MAVPMLSNTSNSQVKTKVAPLVPILSSLHYT